MGCRALYGHTRGLDQPPSTMQTVSPTDDHVQGFELATDAPSTKGASSVSRELTLLCLAGDGIGPEIIAPTKAIAHAAAELHGIRLAFRDMDIGFASLEKHGTTLRDCVVEAARSVDGTVLGPVSHNDYPPRDEGGLNPSGELRKRLDLYANIRPAVTPPGIKPPAGQPLDLVIYRENTEGFYADRNMHIGPAEFMPTDDLVLSMRRVTRAACERIARAAFLEARHRKLSGVGPGRVTAVHKANVLRLGDGLFLTCVREVHAEFPEIELEEILIDAMCAHLVRRAQTFDVVCTTNMYGDILSDLATELAGSIGLAASINAGEAHVVAQAQHGSAPDIAGLDIANPASLIGSVSMLFRWLGTARSDPALDAIAQTIDDALQTALADPHTRTRDLGGPLTTRDFADTVIRSLEKRG